MLSKNIKRLPGRAKQMIGKGHVRNHAERMRTVTGTMFNVHIHMHKSDSHYVENTLHRRRNIIMQKFADFA